MRQRKLTRAQAQSMVLYRVRVGGSRIKNAMKPLPPFCSLVGWDDEGGDPVFVAVLPDKATWRKPADSDVIEAARHEMKTRLDFDPGKPDYFFPDVS